MHRLLANPDPTMLNLINQVEPEKFVQKPKKPKPFYIRHQNLIEQYNFNMDNVMKEELSSNPP